MRCAREHSCNVILCPCSLLLTPFSTQAASPAPLVVVPRAADEAHTSQQATTPGVEVPAPLSAWPPPPEAAAASLVAIVPPATADATPTTTKRRSRKPRSKTAQAPRSTSPHHRSSGSPTPAATKRRHGSGSALLWRGFSYVACASLSTSSASSQRLSECRES